VKEIHATLLTPSERLPSRTMLLLSQATSPRLSKLNFNKNLGLKKRLSIVFNMEKWIGIN